MNSYNVILVDDNPFYRQTLKRILESNHNIKVIGEAENGSEFLKMIETKTPDVVFMDIKMPGMDGVDATNHATANYMNMRIIALTMHNELVYLYKMIEAGAKGFLVKDKHGNEEILEAISTLESGDYYFPKGIINEILEEGEPNVA